jgi:hypothetical protein
VSNDNALARLGETLRAKQDGLSSKQVSWITDGYSLGYLSADEAKARFGQLIDELERGRSGQT